MITKYHFRFLLPNNTVDKNITNVSKNLSQKLILRFTNPKLL